MESLVLNYLLQLKNIHTRSFPLLCNSYIDVLALTRAIVNPEESRSTIGELRQEWAEYNLDLCGTPGISIRGVVGSAKSSQDILLPTGIPLMRLDTWGSRLYRMIVNRIAGCIERLTPGSPHISVHLPELAHYSGIHDASGEVDFPEEDFPSVPDAVLGFHESPRRRKSKSKSRRRKSKSKSRDVRARASRDQSKSKSRREQEQV